MSDTEIDRALLRVGAEDLPTILALQHGASHIARIEVSVALAGELAKSGARDVLRVPLLPARIAGKWGSTPAQALGHVEIRLASDERLAPRLVRVRLHDGTSHTLVL